MKVMHLADLHLGKNILEQSLIEDQRYILEQIVVLAVKENVEIILICGDIYDKGIPNVEAVRLFSEFLTKLHNLKIKVLVISGNHDSRDRLSFGNELFVDNEIFIEGIFNGEVKKVTFSDKYGELNIYMLPFVRPSDVRFYYPDCEIGNYHDAVKTIIDNINIDLSKRNIIMIHQFVTAMGIELEKSDSENIALGGIDNVDVSLFDNFDYVAMGHVHRGQKLIKETVRYAGSPLKYSFSEVNHKKSVPIIEFKAKNEVEIKLVDLIPKKDMRIIKGKLNNLLDNEVIKLGNCDDYISAVITDDDYIMNAIGKLRKVYKNLLRLEYQNIRTLNEVEVSCSSVEENLKKSEQELFEDFYLKQNNLRLNDERLEIIKDIIASIKNDF